MKIAVTGGLGFIGQSFAALAESQGHETWGFDRADGNDVTGDLSGLKGADCVVHLAGLLGTHELFQDAEEAVHVNVTGSLRVMQWCVDHGANYVGITMPDVFPSIYTATKIASQRLATALHRSRRLRVSHVRAFNAYGPGQKFGPGHPQKIVPTFAVKAWRNQPLPIWGDGTQTVDLVHTDDVARVLLAACDLENNEVIDAGTGVPVTVNSLASFVLGYTGSTAGTEHLPMRDGEAPSWIAAKGENWWKLGDWRPTMDWDRIKETLDWYRGR